MFRRHRKRGGESPPPPSSSLTSSLDGRRVSPLVLGSHGLGGARAPPRLDLSLCFCVSDSGLSPFLKFPEIRNSDWAEILTRFLSGYLLSCGERRASTSLRVAHEGQGRAPGGQGRPPASWPPRAPSHVDFSSGIFQIFQKYSPSVLSRLIWVFYENIKHATNRNWHWALDQYVSLKNNIKSCQKYMKVVEYWHGTIKNYRYDGDVSASPSLIPARR